jgi:hypothetical protein
MTDTMPTTEWTTAIMPDGHLVTDVDGANVLIDTGSPATFGRRSSVLRLAEQSVAVREAPAGLEFGRLSRLIGERIDVLLGMDALQSVGFVLRQGREPQISFFWSGGRTARPRALDADCAIELPLRRRAGVPVGSVTFPMAAGRAEAVIDTGAAVSFATRAWLQAMGAPSGTRHDWYLTGAGLEEFDSPTWDVEVGVGGHTQTHRFAVMPDAIAGLLQWIGVTFIIGTDLVRDPALAEVVFAPHRIAMRVR